MFYLHFFLKIKQIMTCSLRWCQFVGCVLMKNIFMHANNLLFSIVHMSYKTQARTDNYIHSHVLDSILL